MAPRTTRPPTTDVEAITATFFDESSSVEGFPFLLFPSSGVGVVVGGGGGGIDVDGDDVVGGAFVIDGASIRKTH